MKKKLILIGGGGHCHAVIDVIESTSNFVIIGIIDNDINVKDVLGYKKIGEDKDILKFISMTDEFFISIGKVGENNRRIDIFNSLKKNNLKIATIISSNAYVSNHASIGKGSIVMHHAMVNANAVIGQNCILNSNCLVEHGVIIGDHSHISTASVINGNAQIGKDVFFGSHSTANLNVSICDGTVISSHSLVTKSINRKGKYKGIPINE